MKSIMSIIASFILVSAIGLIVSADDHDELHLCADYYANMENPPVDAQAWCESGSYFSWQSTLPLNVTFEALNIFHVCEGNPNNPKILMIHGYPTSSFDFALLFERLRDDHYVCALDTPGYGFSDKPLNGFKYSIFDDVKLIDYYIRDIIEFDNFTLLTHNKGNSVGLALLQAYQAYDELPYTINHHVITNGNIYLTVEQLPEGQQTLLNPVAGAIASRRITGEQFATGLSNFFSVPLSEDKIKAYASILNYRDGTLVQHEIIKYLNERDEHGNDWLQTLANSDVLTTVIWGEQDTVIPVTVPDDVWANFLADRPAPASYWRVPCAHHYLQVDQPDLVVEILTTAVADTNISEIDGTDCSAYRIQHNINQKETN